MPNNDLKISPQEIIAAIDLEKETWDNVNTTNCYAYALGLDVPQLEIKKYAYEPGIISNTNTYIYSTTLRYFEYCEFIENIYADLDFLGISYRELDPSDDINQNEWKIALFIAWKNYKNQLVEDFHFLRQRNNGIWYHKNNFGGPVKNTDSYCQQITNPKYCTLNGVSYNKCLCLSLKK